MNLDFERASTSSNPNFIYFMNDKTEILKKEVVH